MSVGAIEGDLLHLAIPPDPAALLKGGAAWLTEAIRRAGSLTGDQAVSRIVASADCLGGSTGRKLLLRVDYAGAPDAPRELFVKFSRDLDDPIRDRGRTQMAREARFALLSRDAAFPIAVPRCLTADYHDESGTGIVITEQIGFGRNGIEPHREKCLDDELPDAVGHYRALLTAVARLAGADRAGALGIAIARDFPFDPQAVDVGKPPVLTAEGLRQGAGRLADFAAAHPQLLPANVRAPAFLAGFAEAAALFPAREAAIRRLLAAPGDLVALCHWNANIDNAWFWRDAAGALRCGLIDWGSVSRMNVAMALWGALSAADTALWDDHFDTLLGLFVREYAAAGGPAVDAREVERVLFLYVATMGLTWLLEAPAYLLRLVPDLADATGPHDSRVRGRERPRNQLHILTNFLNLWETRDIGGVLATVPVDG